MPLDPVRFAVLGPLRAWRGGTEQGLGGARERTFLALLLVRTGESIAVSEIAGMLWGSRPLRSAVNVFRRHVGALRPLLEPGLPARATGDWLTREAGGHRLLTEALSLWRGSVAGGIPPHVRTHPAFDALRREYATAVRDAADAALSAGAAREVLPRPRGAAAEHPLDEPLPARLILALAATGRRPEALQAYENARARLADELGSFAAKRAGATVVELEGASHAVAVSRPKEVADLVRDAVRATS